MSIVVGNSAYHRESAEPFLTQTPLVLLLLASAVVSLYTAVLTFRLYIDVVAKNPLYLLQMVGISWPCKQPTPFRESPFETFVVLMTVILPSGTSIVSRNLHQHSTVLSPRPHSYWHLCVVCSFRDISFTCLSLDL